MKGLLHRFFKNLEVEIFKKPKRSLFLVIIIMGLLAGCGQMGRQAELLEELLQEEPSFEKVLTKKDKLDSQIEELKVRLDQEEKLFQSKVSALRDEFNSKNIQIKEQINQLRLELEPERQRINLMIAQRSQELKFKLKTLKGSKVMMKNVEKLLDRRKHLELPQTERSRWQERVTYLEGRIENLNQEIFKLRKNLRQLKIKKTLLR